MNRYIEHIIKDLVRDTRIDYEIGRIYYPVLPSEIPHSFFFTPYYLPSPSPPTSFLNYCRDTFGLTEEEIKYVWDQYKIIIKDKVSVIPRR
jgi:hypothetical protein